MRERENETKTHETRIVGQVDRYVGMEYPKCITLRYYHSIRYVQEKNATHTHFGRILGGGGSIHGFGFDLISVCECVSVCVLPRGSFMVID